MSNDLTNQHALITGGGSGIGLACARLFAADGARVSLVGRDMARLELAAGTFSSPERVHVYSADVADEGQIEEIVRAAHGIEPLTIAIANAGTGDIAPLDSTDASRWQQVLDTNLNGTFHTFKHSAGAIADAGGGAMCAISSIAGVRTHRFMHA